MHLELVLEILLILLFEVDPEPIIDDIILAPICSGGRLHILTPLIFQLNIVPSGTVYEWIVSGSPGTSQGDSRLPADDAVAVIEQTQSLRLEIPHVDSHIYSELLVLPRDKWWTLRGRII